MQRWTLLSFAHGEQRALHTEHEERIGNSRAFGAAHAGIPASVGALDALDSGVLSCAPDWTVRLVNAAANDMLGGSGRRQTGRSLWEVLPAAGTEVERACRETMRRRTRAAVRDWRPSVGRAFAALNSHQRLDVEIRPLDDGGVLVLLHAHSIPPGPESPGRCATTGSGVPELGGAEERLRELLEQVQAANEAKASFLATISHELRTPITALTGYGELLADQVLGPLPKVQLEVVERMRTVTHHLATMIDEILTYSNVEAGREIVRIAKMDAADAAHAAVAVGEPLAKQKGLTLCVDAPRDMVMIDSDVDKVRQILINLIANAVKFTDCGGVRLHVSVSTTEARWAISDTGMGIASCDISRLFRPFTQIDTGLTRRHGGTGLGLYVSRRLAELLGGRIELESEPQRGSTFTLILPFDGTSGQ
ncbi:MAG: PAS domain-containing sensor histidine kinase [Gemmatimonadaceae bacterium]